MLIRLNKFIAQCGVCSRRKADELIAQGLIHLNGKLVSEQGVSVDPEHDTVTMHGRKLNNDLEKVYYVLNKPRGYICSDSPRSGEKHVGELLPEGKLFSVGRLDKNTTGLLIFTNDGELKNLITHPKSEVEKEYLVKTRNALSNTQIASLENGVMIEVEVIKGTVKTLVPFFAKPKKVEVVKSTVHGSVLLITISEGKKRQIRLMMEKIGAGHIELKRVRIGEIKLGELESGIYRELTKNEIDTLFSVNKN